MNKLDSGYPIVRQHSNIIEIFVCPQSKKTRTVNIEIVLDLDQFQNLVGLEIINLKLEAGNLCLDSIVRYISMTGDGIRYSYDDECDAFYLQLSNERSLYQKAVDGTLILNEESKIVKFIVEEQGQGVTH